LYNSTTNGHHRNPTDLPTPEAERLPTLAWRRWHSGVPVPQGIPLR